MNELADNRVPQGRRHWAWGAVCAMITVVTVAVRYALPVRDGDVWWHMLYGKYFLENKTLIADHTIFSWTPATNDIIYCTWLPDIFLYLLHRVGGLPALFAFRYFCLYFFVLACFLYARRLGKGADPLVWLITLVGILMAYVAAYIKPEIVSFVMMTLLVWNWWRIRAGGNNAHRWCYGLPVVMLIWVNSHGAFVFGFIFLVTVAIGEIMNTWWSHGNALPGRVRRHLWIAMGITLLVPLVNPYGWHYPYQLFHDLLPTQENLAYNNKIAAYLPTFTGKTPYQSYSMLANIAVAIVVCLVLFELKQRKAEWSSILSCMVFALLYSKYFRTTFYFSPVFAFSSIYILSHVFPVSGEHDDIAGKNTVRGTMYAWVVLIVILFISSKSLHDAIDNPEGGVVVGDFGIPCQNPVDEAEYIKENYPHARIGNSYNFGAYLLWKLWPENKVFFDSRHFPYKKWSDDFFNSRSAQGFPELLQKYPAEIWTFDHTENIWSSYFRFSPDWKLAFYGRCGEVFVAKDVPLPPGQEEGYRVAEGIADIKSRYSAFQVFVFALTIYDWKTAESILRSQEERYLGTDREGIVVLYRSLLTGMRAFAEKNFALALEKLDRYRDAVTGLGGYVVISHLNLAQHALDQGNFPLADFHVMRALRLLPDAFYTQYDAALVVRLVSRQGAGKGVAMRDGAPWKEGFRHFLRLVEGDEELFAEEIDFARRVVADGADLEDRSQLLIPDIRNFADKAVPVEPKK